MYKKIILALLGIIAGIGVGISTTKLETLPFHAKKQVPKQVIGFLPYWQLDKANPNEIEDITTLTYFGLTVDGNGHIVKLAKEQEEDPGWYQLHSDKLASYFAKARENNISLSLLISSGDSNAINQMVAKPQEHAKTLINDVAPLRKKYHFSDLNLDIEDTGHASPAAQKNFTQFVTAVKKQLDTQKLGTLTVEISPTDVIKYNLINVSEVTPFANSIVLMAYDFHATESYVTGPIAPLSGAGIDSEYDVTTAVEKTLQSVPSEKLLLGMPLYGYEWETLNTAVRSAIIPGSGVLASDHRMESFLPSCASCNTFFDREAQEVFVVYKDEKTGAYHQFTFPNIQSVVSKITYSDKEHLGGVALWALGYEGGSMLDPLADYR